MQPSGQGEEERHTPIAAGHPAQTKRCKGRSGRLRSGIFLYSSSLFVSHPVLLFLVLSLFAGVMWSL